MRGARGGRLALAVLAWASGASASPRVEYGLSYLAIPAEFHWVERQADSDQWKSLPAVYEPVSENVSLGTVGFSLGVGLPGRLGPYAASLSLGFGLPAGGHTFDHTEQFKPADRLSATAFDDNDAHTGDLTEVRLTTVPLMFMLRYAPPTHAVGFGGEVGLGPVLVDAEVERTEQTYSGGAIAGQTVARTHRVSVAVALRLAGGLVVPVSDALSLNVLGGVLWMSGVDETTTATEATPSLVYGPSIVSPGVSLGGLGYVFRVGLNSGL